MAENHVEAVVSQFVLGLIDNISSGKLCLQIMLVFLE
jgi:hypothetical protein